MKKLNRDNNIITLNYRPPKNYKLDLEIVSLATIRQRIGKKTEKNLEQIDFYLLILVTKGFCTHVVDLESIFCEQGSLLLIQPGQINNFDLESNCDGWVILFRPEFLMPNINLKLTSEHEVFCYLLELPILTKLLDLQFEIITSSFIRMSNDIELNTNFKSIHFLLLNQVQEIISRLYIIKKSNQGLQPSNCIPLQRYKRFRDAVEKNFHNNHQLESYLKYLACSDKSLNRTVQKFSGISAKAFLSKRIVLEAKRFLIHTEIQISSISDNLGFSEATNFTKFFKHEVGCSPVHYRKQYVKTNQNIVNSI